MSDLYYEAIRTSDEIKVCLSNLNEKVNYLFSQSIVMGPKCNDKSNVDKLNEINKELAKTKDDIAIIAFLLDGIQKIIEQFFRETLNKDLPKTAETDYIVFKNSSTYKAVMGGSSLKL